MLEAEHRGRTAGRVEAAGGDSDAAGHRHPRRASISHAALPVSWNTLTVPMLLAASSVCAPGRQVTAEMKALSPECASPLPPPMPPSSPLPAAKACCATGLESAL